MSCGAGQRIGIFGGSGVGKSTLLAAMARNHGADVTVIAMIGERNREVRAFIEQELGDEARKRAVLVTATSDQPAPLRVRACFVAVAVAEYFRDRGAKVLLVDPQLHPLVACAAVDHIIDDYEGMLDTARPGSPARPESLGIQSVAGTAQRRIANVSGLSGHEATGRRLHHALVSGVDGEGTILWALVTFLWIVDFESAVEGLGRAQLFFCDLVTD